MAQTKPIRDQKLTSPKGTHVTVSKQRAEVLRKRGYTDGHAKSKAQQAKASG